jgi:hypothetical protein
MVMRTALRSCYQGYPELHKKASVGQAAGACRTKPRLHPPSPKVLPVAIHYFPTITRESQKKIAASLATRHFPKGRLLLAPADAQNRSVNLRALTLTTQGFSRAS